MEASIEALVSFRVFSCSFIRYTFRTHICSLHQFMWICRVVLLWSRINNFWLLSFACHRDENHQATPTNSIKIHQCPDGFETPGPLQSHNSNCQIVLCHMQLEVTPTSWITCTLKWDDYLRNRFLRKEASQKNQAQEGAEPPHSQIGIVPDFGRSIFVLFVFQCHFRLPFLAGSQEGLQPALSHWMSWGDSRQCTNGNGSEEIHVPRNSALQ